MADVEIGEFIAARIGEEEADARALSCTSWSDSWTTVIPEGRRVSALVNVVAESSTGPVQRLHHVLRAVGEHVARQDPAATLARVVALRALVDELGFWTTGHEEIVYRSLAAIWSWHPDYRAEWAA